MIGAIAGDLIGSPYESNNISNEDFGPLFADKSFYTDDTVLTVATAAVILDDASYSDYYLRYATAYPKRGYGGSFKKMVKSGELKPYNSYGNGSAMRVSPIGWAYDNDSSVIYNAMKSAQCTHDHKEGVKGAQAIARSIHAARKGFDKQYIKNLVEKTGYDLSRGTSDFEQGKFDVSCQETIPLCMAIFFETNGFESAMRKAVSIGGDVDTNCSIVGGICDGFYGLPSKDIIEEVYARIPIQMAKIVTLFTQKYIDKNFKQPEKICTKFSSIDDSLYSKGYSSLR